MVRIICFMVALVVSVPRGTLAQDDPTRCDRVTTYGEALRIAKAEHRPLMVFITTKGCAPCLKAKRDVIDPMVAADLLGGSVLVEVDIISEEGRALRRTLYAPQLMVFHDRNGEPVRSHIDGTITKELVTRLVDRIYQRR